MKKCYLDSNVLIYFLNQGCKQHQRSKQIIQELILQEFTFVASGLVLDEVLYIFTQFSKQCRQTKVGENNNINQLQQILNLLEQKLAIKLINIQPQFSIHSKITNLMRDYQLQPRDAYHLLHCLQNQVHHLVTFDKDFYSLSKSPVKLIPGFESK
jgi:predicted nucleic acid-binding protein